MTGEDPERCAAIDEQARIVVADAEREVAQRAGLDLMHAEAESVLHATARRLGPAAGRPPAGRAARLGGDDVTP